MKTNTIRVINLLLCLKLVFYSLTLHAFEVNAGEDLYTLQLSHPQSPPINANWQVGDEWIVDVEVYDRSPQEAIFKHLQPDVNIWDINAPITTTKQDTTKIDYRYALHIKVVDIGNYRGEPYWKIMMTPIPDSFRLAETTEQRYQSNSILEDSYELWVRKSNQTLINIIYSGKEAKANPSTRTYTNKLRVIEGGHWREIPYDIIPYATNDKIPNIQIEAIDNQYNSINIHKQMNDSTKIIKLYYNERHDKGDHGYITQTWKTGAKWWHTYENRSDEKVYLRAKLREETP